jgi:hypothetical protein
VGVDSKCDRGKEDYEEKFNTHDTSGDGSAQVFKPPYYEKRLGRNGLIRQHVGQNSQNHNHADKCTMPTNVAKATYGSPN